MFPNYPLTKSTVYTVSKPHAAEVLLAPWIDGMDSNRHSVVMVIDMARRRYAKSQCTPDHPKTEETCFGRRWRKVNDNFLTNTVKAAHERVGHGRLAMAVWHGQVGNDRLATAGWHYQQAASSQQWWVLAG